MLICISTCSPNAHLYLHTQTAPLILLSISPQCARISPLTPDLAFHRLLMDLPLPLLEDVLASLPLRSLIAVSATSKYLHSFVSSASFALLRSHSAAASPAWFFFFGFNRLLPERSQAFAFDPLSSSWISLPLSTPPPHNSASLSVSAGGSLVALAGAQQTYVCIAPSLVKQDWQMLQTPMRVPRRSNPLIQS
ncbi:hypothetical protein KP509_30G072800 [Ceratopteris richardii]|uniref:F-box domain-containing protein n=1 Tax=Ceratopteris richardii TaxID=49495 RepID=A0A8T2R5G6_CERRI|nr:hypothetical protein KP509_30G072800 [Ceratopteris richardii]